MTRRIFTALLGLAAGIITWPIAAIVWPAFCAWFLYNESEDYDV